MFGLGAKKATPDPVKVSDGPGLVEGKTNPVASDPGDKRKQDLWDYAQKFIDEQDIFCAETCYQTDRVNIYAPGFVNGCADIVGYKKRRE